MVYLVTRGVRIFKKNYADVYKSILSTGTFVKV
jgi:hypothetical protein